MSAKQEVMNLLQTLPDDCSLEDILYQLHVVIKVKGSEAHAAANGTISQDEAERRLGKWLEP